jgi:hypothetical protein
VKEVLLCQSNGSVCPELYFSLVYISFGQDRQDGQDAVVRPQTDVSAAMCINIRSRQMEVHRSHDILCGAQCTYNTVCDNCGYIFYYTDPFSTTFSMTKFQFP